MLILSFAKGEGPPKDYRDSRDSICAAGEGVSRNVDVLGSNFVCYGLLKAMNVGRLYAGPLNARQYPHHYLHRNLSDLWASGDDETLDDGPPPIFLMRWPPPRMLGVFAQKAQM
jgi:hypothetical protein